MHFNNIPFSCMTPDVTGNYLLDGNYDSPFIFYIVTTKCEFHSALYVGYRTSNSAGT